jgi:putative ABC transport system permease protein
VPAVRAVNGEPDFELRSQRSGFDEALYERVARPSADRHREPGDRDRHPGLRCEGRRVPLKIVGIDALVAAPIAPALVPKPNPARRRCACSTRRVFLNAPARERLAGVRRCACRRRSGSVELTVRGSVAASGSRSR